jgi:hypothetical protein
MTQATKYEMSGAIYWPSGMGYRECSAGYESAYEARQAAKDALDDAEDTGADSLALQDNLYFAQSWLTTLQTEGGHLGKSVHFEVPDMTAAALGGGRIRILQAA